MSRVGRRRLLHVVRLALSTLAVAFVAAAVVRRWSDIAGQLDQLTLGWTLLAFGFVLAGLGANALTWKALLADLGSPLPVAAAGRIFLLGQLGKYLPGTVWAVYAQMELGARYAVPRRRSAATSIVTIVLGLVAGAVLAAGALAIASPDLTRRFWPLLLAIPLGLALLWPPLLSALIDRALRLIRREPLEHPLTPRGVATALGWSLLSWVLLGLHVWALARELGPSRPVLLLAVGAFAAAWTIGFLVVVAPAGVGPREAVLVLVMGAALTTGPVLLLALVSRLLMTVGDAVWALVAVLLSGRPAGPPRRPAADGAVPAGPVEPDPVGRPRRLPS